MAHIGASQTATATPSIIETFSLITDDSGDASKRPNVSAFIIRLTDASLKSLQEAIAESKRDRAKAGSGYVEIKSSGGNEGVLSFGGSTKTEHHFSILDEQRNLGPAGQLEGIVEMPKNATTGGIMRSVGSITKRISIAATTQDTFESTKQKTKQAEKAAKEGAAKVLKGPAITGLSTKKKVWEKLSKAQASTSQRPLTPLSHIHRSASPITGPGGKLQAPSAVKRPAVNSELMKKPLRQRISYRLIAAPSTAQDLLAKLTNEGLADEDRAKFEATLNQVAQIRSDSDGKPTRGGIYEVKKSLHHEIKPDEWPFYSPWERNVAKKYLITTTAPPNSNASDSTDEADSGRVKTKGSYRAPPPKRHVVEPSAAQKVPSSSSVSPSTAAAIDGVSAVSISDVPSPPRKRVAHEKPREER